MFFEKKKNNKFSRLPCCLFLIHFWAIQSRYIAAVHSILSLWKPASLSKIHRNRTTEKLSSKYQKYWNNFKRNKQSQNRLPKWVKSSSYLTLIKWVDYDWGGVAGTSCHLWTYHLFSFTYSHTNFVIGVSFFASRYGGQWINNIDFQKICWNGVSIWSNWIKRKNWKLRSNKIKCPCSQKLTIECLFFHVQTVVEIWFRCTSIPINEDEKTKKKMNLLS